MISKDVLFFPQLKRRSNYKTKRNGDYYSDYSEYRQEIREDCMGRCVYCDIHEKENGGAENMNLDHFRPKEKFGNLKSNPNNLHLSCTKCNNLKNDKWPSGDADILSSGAEGFICPFNDNRNKYFEILPDGKLGPLKHPAEYKIRLLALNRPSRKKVRFKRIQNFEKLGELKSRIDETETVLKNNKNIPRNIKLLLEKNIKDIQSQIDNILNSELNFDLA
jgi:uncharacterized protein (TIGR02646 family)